jgi:hypothetical protein
MVCSWQYGWVGPKQTSLPPTCQVPPSSQPQFLNPVKQLPGSRGYIDPFWPGRVVGEHKSAGQDLHKHIRRFDVLNTPEDLGSSRTPAEPHPTLGFSTIPPRSDHGRQRPQRMTRPRLPTAANGPSHSARHPRLLRRPGQIHSSLRLAIPWGAPASRRLCAASCRALFSPCSVNGYILGRNLLALPWTGAQRLPAGWERRRP